MALGMVMKRTLFILLVDLVGVLIPLMLGPIIPSTGIVMATFLLPVIISLILVHYILRGATEKSKALVFLMTFVVVTAVPSIFCVWGFHTALLDYGGVAFIVVFTVVFNSLPSLMISLIYFIRALIRKEFKKQ